MAADISRLDELIALRAREKEEAQRDHTRQVAAQVDEALGARLLEAMDPSREGGWEADLSSAVRRFAFRGTEFHLVVHAIMGSSRVEVELRHADMRFTPLARKAPLQEVGEDWFLGSLEGLANQVRDRLVNPRNFT